MEKHQGVLVGASQVGDNLVLVFDDRYVFVFVKMPEDIINLFMGISSIGLKVEIYYEEMFFIGAKVHFSNSILEIGDVPEEGIRSE